MRQVELVTVRCNVTKRTGNDWWTESIGLWRHGLLHIYELNGNTIQEIKIYYCTSIYLLLSHLNAHIHTHIYMYVYKGYYCKKDSRSYSYKCIGIYVHNSWNACIVEFPIVNDLFVPFQLIIKTSCFHFYLITLQSTNY